MIVINAIRSARVSAGQLGAGAWVVIAALTFLLFFAIVVAYLGWMAAPGTVVPVAGYVAMALGVVLSLMIGIGLMGLVFFSSRYGYDESAISIAGDEPSEKIVPFPNADLNRPAGRT